MPMKKIYLLFIFVIFTLLSHAQQIGMYSHYYFKPMVYNPAFTGADEGISAMIISRNQWSGFKGAPQLNIFTLDGNIHNKAGLGLQLISDRKGLSNRIGGNVSYSYRFMINEEAYFALGVSAGVINQTIDYSKAILENNSDPALFNTVENTIVLDANAGLAFKWKGLDIGVAVPQLAGNKVNYLDNEDVRSYYTQTRHYMGSVKYKIPVSEDLGLSVTPLALVRYLPNTPIQYDGTLMIGWQDKIWLGGTYKSDYAVGLNAGVTIHQKLSVGYSYDYIIGKIGTYSGMSHELMISFRFGSKKEETVVEKPAQQNNEKTEKSKGKIFVNKIYESRMDSLQQQIDSLQKHINGVQSNVNTMKNSINRVQDHADTLQKNVDTLQKHLRESEERIKKLSEKLDEQKNQVVPVSENKNSEAIESNKNKVMVDGIWFVKNKTKDFQDETNHEPQKGFYVIVGTFIYRDLAVAESKRFHEKGFKTANWVYYNNKKFNYVYLERILSKEEALKHAKDIRATGIKDVWVQELIKESNSKSK